MVIKRAERGRKTLSARLPTIGDKRGKNQNTQRQIWSDENGHASDKDHWHGKSNNTFYHACNHSCGRNQKK